MTLTGVLKAIDERKFQDSKWGGPSHDDEHDELDWIGFIREYINGRNRAASYCELTKVTKSAALALAALESYHRRNEAPKSRQAIIGIACGLGMAISNTQGEEFVKYINSLLDARGIDFETRMSRVLGACIMAMYGCTPASPNVGAVS